MRAAAEAIFLRDGTGGGRNGSDVKSLSADTLRLLVVLLGSLAVLQTARLWWRDAARRFRDRRRSARAVAGEAAAEDLLRGLGYAITDRQAPLQYALQVDGAPHPVSLRADYLVERGGRRYVAEVKTGGQAPSLRTAATRRQLLEYRLAYAVDGVLLVDMEASAVREVVFPLPLASAPSGPRPWPALALAVAVALAGAYLLSRR